MNLFLCGHQHSFERSCQVYRGVCTPGAPMYVISGASGATFGDWPVDPARRAWVEFYDTQVNGFHLFSAANRTHLRVRFVRNHDMGVSDDVWLVKQPETLPAVTVTPEMSPGVTPLPRGSPDASTTR